jgi:hypothetical protein
LDFYEANLDAIKQRSEAYFNLLKSQPTQRKLKIVDNPQTTDKTIETLKQHENEGIVVVLGFGEGDLAMKILDVLGKGFALVIYEFNHPQFNRVLHMRDFTKLWTDNRVALILQESEGFGFFEYMRQYIIHGRLWMLIHPESKASKRKYEKICEKMAKAKALFEVNVGTQVGMGKHFMNSLLENIPEIIKKHGVTELKDIYKDKPCVCISPGPSLKKDIEMLKQNKDKAIYIAVDCVVPYLMEHDFMPDFICGIDPLEDNARLFTDPRLKDVPLIAIMQYTPEVIRNYPGQVFMSSQYGNQIFQWLGQHWQDRGAVDCPGGSVSHFAIGIAEYLGCNPIAIIGQDLSFKDSYYCADIGKILDVPGKPLDRTEGKIPTKNMYGKKVFTTGIFMAFKMWFESKFESMKDKQVFNLSDGGLRIAHSKEMKFADFITEHGQPIERQEIKPSPLTSNKDGIISELTQARDLLNKVVDASKRVIPKLHEVMRILPEKNKDAINKLVYEIHDLKKETDHFFLTVIYAYHFKIDLYLNRFDVREADNIPDRFECLKAQTDKGINYYGELIEASELFLAQLEKVLNSFGVFLPAFCPNSADTADIEHREAVNE